MTSAIDDAATQLATGTVAATVTVLEPDKVHLSVSELTLQGLVLEPWPPTPASGHGAARIANFRNVQYGRIAGRWYKAVPVDLLSTVGVWDATQWGLRSPQTLDVMHGESSHLYPRMSIYDRVSEFDCLNLNICTPLATLLKANGMAASALLPVIVWIHGGSFEWGDGGSECGGYSKNASEFEFVFLFFFLGLGLGLICFYLYVRVDHTENSSWRRSNSGRDAMSEGGPAPHRTWISPAPSVEGDLIEG
jgi:hypothetical protein